MEALGFEEHLTCPRGRGDAPPGASSGSAGGGPCGDLVRFSVVLDGDSVSEARFEASGCGAVVAAGSAAVALVEGASVLDAGRVGPPQIAQELGGLSPGKLHAADLAAEALARALGAAVSNGPVMSSIDGRVLVAMSGGVDSAVAALISRREGREPVAVTLELWRDPEGDAEASCCSASAVLRARRVARDLGIPHFTLDLREEFRGKVVDPWLAAHGKGTTPNPCIACNGELRLGAMLRFADRIGAERLATGHYARLDRDADLRIAADPGKDQSFMLASVDPATLARLEFPLGEWTKDEVREAAAQAGLEVADAPDSQDLCFLAGVGRERFLGRFGAAAPKRGRIVDREGTVLGRHDGAYRFTVGQRRGLEIGGLDEPFYVLATDTESNTVTVGPREALSLSEIEIGQLRLRESVESVSSVRLRSHAPAVGCRIDGTRLRLERPVCAPAPGQTAVFLDGDRVVGCATIA